MTTFLTGDEAAQCRLILGVALDSELATDLAIDHEWLDEDYKFYWRHFEDEQDNGNIDPNEAMLTFEQWLSQQPTDYLQAHGVTT